MATSAADGSCDVSPKGDPAGFVHVLDDQTLVMPERPGNKRADGWVNVLSNPHVGLIFVVPGRSRHPAGQRPGPAGARGAVPRRPGRQRAPAAAGAGRRDRADLPPLRQGVPALPAVGPGHLGPRTRCPAGRSSRGRWSGRTPTSPSSTPTTAPRTPTASTAPPDQDPHSCMITSQLIMQLWDLAQTTRPQPNNPRRSCNFGDHRKCMITSEDGPSAGRSSVTEVGEVLVRVAGHA